MSIHLADFLDKCMELGAKGKSASNWILSDISRLLNENNMEPSQIPFPAEHLVKLISIIEKGTISNNQGKKVIEELFVNPHDPEDIIKEKGLVQISDESALQKIVVEIIDNNPQSVADYKGGKDKAIGFLVGQTMRATKGQGNPQILNKLIKEELDKR